MRDTLISPIWLFGCLLLAVLLASLLPRRRWPATVLAGVALAAWWALAAPVTANWALGQLEGVARTQARRCGAPRPGSLFIVLAGGVRESGAAAGSVISLSGASLRRTVAAERIASDIPGSRLLFSGGHGGRHTEADLMRALALRLGFPAARIATDSVSLTTFESARNLTRRLAGTNHGPLYLVTSAEHMPRAYMAFRLSGLDVCALPVDFEAAPSLPAQAWVPSEQGLDMMSRALHEYLGIPYYRFKLAGRRPG